MLCLFVFICVFVRVCVFVCLSLFVCLCVFVCVCVFLFVCLFARSFVYWLVRWFVGCLLIACWLLAGCLLVVVGGGVVC